MINREKLEQTKTLEEAVKLLFGVNMKGRTYVLPHEEMKNGVARGYNELGAFRNETYQKIADDFRSRTNYSGSGDGYKKIIEVGSGSGLLTLKLAEKTDAIIFGIDSSKDMVKLAKKNHRRAVEATREEIMSDYRKGGYDFSGNIPARYDVMPEILSVAENKFKTQFFKCNVYDLVESVEKGLWIDYIVCRNALHRFKEPEKAINQMYSVLTPGGKIYLRDVRRDADWKTLLERIGDERWKRPELVEDYVGAMASSLTKEELGNILSKQGMNFEITDGEYKGSHIKKDHGMKEFEKETEYVCIINKK